MRPNRVARTFLFLALSLALDSAVTICGAAAAPAPKTFAVFVTAYNPGGGQVRGGVAGSLFFTSTREALTAYHVLQPSSFTPPPGFRKVRIWLVHENERPIELRADQLRTQPERDLTRVVLSSEVDSRYVYQTDRARPRMPVYSDGFRANTAGPTLAWVDGEVEITGVPKLERVSARGRILRRARIDLTAADVKLANSPNFELDYEPIVGMSGGPVVSGGKVIAMNSFADPVSRRRTWALELLSTP